jgi:hypothetical protein
MEQETSMGRLVAARLAAGVDSESIVRELSHNFDYVLTALRGYVDRFVEADHGTAEAEQNQQQPRSFRLAR